jgi:hypothetical protein
MSNLIVSVIHRHSELNHESVYLVDYNDYIKIVSQSLFNQSFSLKRDPLDAINNE